MTIETDEEVTKQLAVCDVSCERTAFGSPAANGEL
jgi:hypothetical protein